MSDDFAMRLADAPDLPFVMALQRKNRESVGGLPGPAILERVNRRTLLLGLLNGEPCGYLLFDYRDHVIRVPQACIQYDARRRKYGEDLVGMMFNLCPDATETRLRCAADIDANLFWRTLGFVCTTIQQGGTRRGRLINVWQKWHDRRLFAPSVVAVSPAWQGRQDCRDEETGFMVTTPDGFADHGELPKLAWSNRKAAR